MEKVLKQKALKEKIEQVLKTMLYNKPIEWTSYNSFMTDMAKYKIYTKEERLGAVSEVIPDFLDALSAGFLSSVTGIDAEEFIISDSKRVLSLIQDSCGINKFINAAIDKYGYGSFISTYNSKEIEVKINGCIYYLYRQI